VSAIDYIFVAISFGVLVYLVAVVLKAGRSL